MNSTHYEKEKCKLTMIKVVIGIYFQKGSGPGKGLQLCYE